MIVETLVASAAGVGTLLAGLAAVVGLRTHKSVKPNGQGTVVQMLEHVLADVGELKGRLEVVDRRLDHLERAPHR